MKKILAVVAVVAVLGVVFVPRLVHECGDCGKTFFGTGYEPNLVSDLLTDEDKVICKECAELEHALSILAGKSLDEFKRGLFD